MKGVTKSKLTSELIGDYFGETVPPGNHTAEDKQNSDILPDLVVNREDTIPVTTDPTRHDISLDPGTTESEDDAVDALLSLGREGNVDQNTDKLDENSQLMPIGGTNLPLDVAPVPVKLDQISVDREIADLPVELTLPVTETPTVPTTTKPPESPKSSVTNEKLPSSTLDT